MNKLIDVIIVDDDANASSSIELMLELTLPDCRVLAVAETVATAVEKINKLKPELVFLDIMLPDGKGFEVIQQSAYKEYEVIFTTSYDDYAIIAFEFSALHYLLKPINQTSLKEAIERFLEKYQMKNYLKERINNINNNSFQIPEKIVISTDKGLIFYDITSIVKIESDGNYSKIFFDDGNSKIFSKNLGILETALQDQSFVKINRSQLINLKYINHINKSKKKIILSFDDHEYSISDNCKNDFFEKIEHFAKVIK
jgi:two-component system LytT family response regulator